MYLRSLKSFKFILMSMVLFSFSAYAQSMPLAPLPAGSFTIADTFLSQDGLTIENPTILFTTDFNIDPGYCDNTACFISWKIIATPTVNVNNPVITITAVDIEIQAPYQYVDVADDNGNLVQKQFVEGSTLYDGKTVGGSYITDERYVTSIEASLRRGTGNPNPVASATVPGQPFASLFAKGTVTQRQQLAITLAQAHLHSVIEAAAPPPDNVFQFENSNSGYFGYTYVKYQHYYRSKKVFGSKVVYEVDDILSGINTVTDLTQPGISVDVNPAITAQTALAISANDLSNQNAFIDTPGQELVIFKNSTGQFLLSYDIFSTKGPHASSGLTQEMIDAKTGAIIERWIDVPLVEPQSPQAPAGSPMAPAACPNDIVNSTKSKIFRDTRKLRYKGSSGTVDAALIGYSDFDLITNVKIDANRCFQITQGKKATAPYQRVNLQRLLVFGYSDDR